MVGTFATDYCCLGRNKVMCVKDIVDPKRKRQRPSWPMPRWVSICVLVNGGIRIHESELHEPLWSVKRGQAVKITQDDCWSQQVHSVHDRDDFR